MIANKASVKLLARPFYEADGRRWLEYRLETPQQTDSKKIPYSL